MNKISLYNRDRANLYLEKSKDINENISEWTLKVDDKHLYVLEYIRIIGNYPEEIDAIDPSGGPYISIGDTFNNYEIIKFVNCTTLLLSERNKH